MRQLDIFTAGDQGSPGLGILRSKIKDLDSRLQSGAAKGYTKSYLHEIRENAKKEIETEYAAAVAAQAARLRNEIGEFQKLYQTKFGSPNDIRYRAERARLAVDAMGDDELQRDYIDSLTGRGKYVHPEEIEVFQKAARDRLGEESFLTLRKHALETRYNEPWLKFCPELAVDCETLERRRPGEFLTKQKSELNPGAVGWIAQDIDNLIPEPPHLSK